MYQKFLEQAIVVNHGRTISSYQLLPNCRKPAAQYLFLKPAQAGFIRVALT